VPKLAHTGSVALYVATTAFFVQLCLIDDGGRDIEIAPILGGMSPSSKRNDARNDVSYAKKHYPVIYAQNNDGKFASESRALYSNWLGREGYQE
jgi:hypothetical protein